MSNYSTGHDAEKAAAEFLHNKGFNLRELNWKTRYCEIDIVAQKDGTIYFVEVKSRKNSRQGYGTDYITTKKLHQMRFAAEMWVQEHGWRGDYQLAVVSIDAGEISLIDSIDA